MHSYVCVYACTCMCYITLVESVVSGLRSTLEEESEKAREGFRKMESLLEVARREQAKTAVQLQHLQQQAERDKERAVEAVELSRAQLVMSALMMNEHTWVI